MQAHNTDLCIYAKRIEYAATVEEIETKVTLRQEPH